MNIDLILFEEEARRCYDTGYEDALQVADQRIDELLNKIQELEKENMKLKRGRQRQPHI